ncbi:MaoC family dehydratase N-terminal domain-containing protein [Spirillospora sp. NPDC048819]|uniref:MaoC family dehydratase N-terminal domain-containing protein n=1 Tax=Spirillospora sp. NPDC048819 TaxID=3155268 RepID=UPI0033ED16B0
MARTDSAGLSTPPSTVEVERGRLRLFAKAIGETDPVYTDLGAAGRAGHRDLPVPPTFLFCLEMERPDPFVFLAEAGVDLNRVLHGEQSFTYHALCHAGDTLTFESRITDDYERKGGALRFLVRQTRVTREDEPIADLGSVIVVQQPEAGT